ncbi:hypothetical protein FDUTEX481_06107 [Tolypothrix sp. PCC 7601]|nr:hypothetical protein FDUTEX481_06107 [Tolypothrix sp. PCC 7601]
MLPKPSTVRSFATQKQNLKKFPEKKLTNGSRLDILDKCLRAEREKRRW